MTALPDLPKTLERPCCRLQPCGLTTLELEVVHPDVAAGESPLPPLYRYVRASNGNEYGPDWSSAAVQAAWIEESAAEMAADAKYLDEVRARENAEGEGL